MVNHQIVLIRGGGDLASGVAMRLHRVGLRVVIAELEQPLVIRRSVSFAQAVFSGVSQVEGITARKVDSFDSMQTTWLNGEIPVLVDPQCMILDRLNDSELPFTALIDARMKKNSPTMQIGAAPFMVGLGPGFVAGVNCDAVVETNRGHYLGRVLWKGSAQPNTGVPGGFNDKYKDRVLYSPAEGIFQAKKEICDRVRPGELIGVIDGKQIRAPFKGIIRGLLHSGLHVTQGFKIGDVDPRADPEYCQHVSDKALAIGGGVLEAILAREAQLNQNQ